jgi:hypothetical protein
MNEPMHCSPDLDPSRDPALARLLRAAESAPAVDDVDVERLRAAVMRRAVSSGGARPDAPREWWDVVVQWRRLAAAASLAAILGAGALLWGADDDSADSALAEAAAPESVALARVVGDYPDDAVFTSFIQTAGSDELSSWEDR